MINVTFYKRADSFTGFEFSGHSDYAEEGFDIVCAAVSSAAYLTANLLSDSFSENTYVTVSDGHMILTVEKSDNSDRIIEGLYQHLLQLEDQYTKDIIVKITEV